MDEAATNYSYPTEEQTGPTRRLEFVDESRWAIVDGEGRVFFAGSTRECEDWLDHDEHRRRSVAARPLRDALAAAVPPAGFASLALAALALPFRAASAIARPACLAEQAVPAADAAK